MKKLLTLLGAAIFLVSCTSKTANEGLNTTNTSEKEELAQLYEKAKLEGNELTVWGGGDAPKQLDWIKNEWAKDFPDIKINIRVDLSKFLDIEIDDQLSKNALIPDIVHLQTIHNFHRWKSQDELENFKPFQWDQIPDDLKDADGAYTPIYMISFGMLVNRDAVSNIPTSYVDLLGEKFKDRMMLTYPHDDDATLYLYKKIVDKYGWEYIDNLIKQNPKWIRGTATPVAQVAKGNYIGTMGAAGAFDTAIDGGAQVVLPQEDHFLTWAQTAGIFKKSKHKETAKLYLTWLLSKKMQNNWVQWSVRKDMPTKATYKSYREYSNTSPVEFREFMLDREALNKFSKELEEKIGPVTGGSPLTDPTILRLLNK